MVVLLLLLMILLLLTVVGIKGEGIILMLGNTDDIPFGVKTVKSSVVIILAYSGVVRLRVGVVRLIPGIYLLLGSAKFKLNSLFPCCVPILMFSILIDCCVIDCIGV